MPDRSVDVAIVGGGVAGSSLGVALARRRCSVVICDPERDMAREFRAEKISPRQIASLGRLGLEQIVRERATPIDTIAIARHGRIVEQRPGGELGIAYCDLVTALRDALPSESRMCASVVSIEADGATWRLGLSDGGTITARLVVVATGLGHRLLAPLGIQREMRSAGHCLVLGFDVEADAPEALPNLTLYGPSPADGIAYLSLFPIAARMRANLFLYRRIDDPMVRDLRRDPQAALFRLLPDLATLLPSLRIVGGVDLRPVDLYASEGVDRDGVVLIGDAFATACPAGGGGVEKALADVEALAELVPGWLASEGMGRDKIRAFYRHNRKKTADRSAARAAVFARSSTLATGLVWATRRRARYFAQCARAWLRTNLSTAQHGR